MEANSLAAVSIVSAPGRDLQAGGKIPEASIPKGRYPTDLILLNKIGRREEKEIRSHHRYDEKKTEDECK